MIWPAVLMALAAADLVATDYLGRLPLGPEFALAQPEGPPSGPISFKTFKQLGFDEDHQQQSQQVAIHHVYHESSGGGSKYPAESAPPDSPPGTFDLYGVSSSGSRGEELPQHSGGSNVVPNMGVKLPSQQLLGESSLSLYMFISISRRYISMHS